MKFIIRLILITLIFLFSLSCKSSTEPEETDNIVPYMTINIGDIRQYVDVISGLYFQWEVVDTITRIDGQKIFRVEETFIMPKDGLFSASNYYFIRDNIFYTSDYDSVGAKFIDSKIAKVYPQEGDYFLSNENIEASEQVHFKVSILDSLNTQCGKFFKVAEYKRIESGSAVSQSIYYAPVYGHIGSTLGNENGKINILASYIKTRNIKIGNYVQFSLHDTYNKKMNISSTHRKIFTNYLINRTKQ